MKQSLISSFLALSLLAVPSMALADGIVQLSPLNNSTTSSPSAITGLRDEAVPLRGRISTIPKGTTMMVKLDQPISSFSSNLGDAISATLENDIYANDTVIVPAGSEVLGQVSNVNRAGKLGRHGEIDVRFFSIKTPDGVVVPIRAHVVTKDETGVLKGNSYAMDVFKGVGITAGATGVGAALGVASGSLLGAVTSGVLFGTAMGGIAGASYALMRQGKDVIIPSGARISIVSDQPTSTTP
jgi:hypothetical protein